jgi:hypothetical protein
MLFKLALGLLSAWGVGVAGLADGQIVHVLLLVGLLLLLLSLAREREAATRHHRGNTDR